MAISTTSQQQAGTAGRANEPASRQPFVADIKAIRERARQHMVDGAVTAGYGKDQAQAHAVLNSALATELVCVLRYKRHYFMASGIHAQSVADEFLEHANEEQVHADQIAQRISAGIGAA